MQPCHTKPFVLPGVVIHRELATERDDSDSAAESCDYCGSRRLEWRKCKLICAN